MKLLLLFCALFVLFNLTIAAPAPKPAAKSARQIDMDDDLPPEDLPPVDGNGNGNGGGNGRPLVTTSKEGGRRNVGVNIPYVILIMYEV